MDQEGDNQGFQGFLTVPHIGEFSYQIQGDRGTDSIFTKMDYLLGGPPDFLGQALNQWLLFFSTNQNGLEDSLKQWLLGPTPEFLV